MHLFSRSIVFFAALSLLLGSAGCLGMEKETFPTLPEVIEADAELSIAFEGLERTGLIDPVVASPGFTVTCFIPSNTAFEAYFAANNLADLDEVPLDQLENLLAYHLLVGSSSLENIRTGFYTTFSEGGAEGRPLGILINRLQNDFRLNNAATVVRPNIRGSNGYLHVVNQVVPLPGILDLARFDTTFSVFLEAVERAGFTASLQNQNDLYTILLPTNEGFTRFFDEGGIGGLEDLTDEEVRDLVRYHLLIGNLTREDLGGGGFAGREIATLLPGKNIMVRETNSIEINGEPVLGFNLQGTNGVVHLLNDVLEIPE
jgi:transforming growth factor-beta-induced protein